MNKHFYLGEHRIYQNERLTDSSKELLKWDKSQQTVAAYESDWDDFLDWCLHHESSYFPADPETIVNYINDLSAYAKANTIARRIAAISENYNASPLAMQNPCASPLVKGAMKSIRRKIGTFQQGKSPLLKEDILEIVELLDEENLVDLRDKTLLVIGFMAAMRRSEIVAISVENIRFSRRGAEIMIPRSKADQEGRGNIVALPMLPDSNICPVRLLHLWLKKSGITNGPVFRGFTKSGSLRKTGLSDQMVNKIVKLRVSQIGLNPEDFGAHSLRHGFATSAALAGVEERNIMQQTRHHSVEMVRHYIGEADRFEHNPLHKIFADTKKSLL